MFELGVLELYVRTLDSNRGFGCLNLGFELPPPESSNSGLVNSMFEPGVWETLCWNRFWSPQGVLASGTLCSNTGLGNSILGLRSLELLPAPEFELWVPKLHVPFNNKAK